MIVKKEIITPPARDKERREKRGCVCVFKQLEQSTLPLNTRSSIRWDGSGSARCWRALFSASTLCVDLSSKRRINLALQCALLSTGHGHRHGSQEAAALEGPCGIAMRLEGRVRITLVATE